VWEDLEKHLRNMRAREMKKEITSKPSGLNAEAVKEDDIYQGLMMAVDGYGAGSLDGELDRRQVRISTKQDPVTKKVLAFEDPGSVLRQLRREFLRIWRRTKTDDEENTE
jgi:hypothetical protein